MQESYGFQCRITKSVCAGGENLNPSTTGCPIPWKRFDWRYFPAPRAIALVELG
jgi:hypothetical protein